MSKSGNEIYRVIHNPIPDEWRGYRNVDVVQDLHDTSYLSDDAPPDTSLYLAGNDLGQCVLTHLMELATRQPVVDSRATLYLSRSHTITWHQSADRVESPTSEEFENIVRFVLERTRVEVFLYD